MSTEPEKKTTTDEALKAGPAVNLVTEAHNNEPLSPVLVSKPITYQSADTAGAVKDDDAEVSPAYSSSSASGFGFSDSAHFASNHPFLQQAPVSHHSKFEFKQIANGVYFGFGALAMAEVALNWNLPHMIPMVALFSFCALAGFFFATRRHAHHSDSGLHPSSRHALRLLALALPVPFMISASSDLMAQTEVKRGDKALRNDQQDAAMVHYKLASKLNPRSVKALEGASTIYWLQENNELSLQSAEEAIALAPDDSDAWCNKGRAEFALDENSPTAIASLEKARALDPNNGEVYSALSDVYASRDNLPEALIAAQKHVELHPDEEYAQEQKSALLDEMSQKGEKGTKSAVEKAPPSEPVSDAAEPEVR